MFSFFHTRKLAKNVREHGYALVSGEDGPTYCYTVGLWESAGSPELVVYGLEPSLGRNALMNGVDELRAGRSALSDGARCSGVLQGFDCVWRKVDSTQLDSLRFGSWYRYRHAKTGRLDGLEMYQLVWPDKEARFPWDEGCNPLARIDQRPLYLPANPENPDAWVEAVAREVGYPG